MFDPKDFARWLRQRHPQYNPLPDTDLEFIKAVSEGDLTNMAAYDSNRQFFMKKVVEYVVYRSVIDRAVGLAIGLGIGLLLFGWVVIVVVLLS